MDIQWIFIDVVISFVTLGIPMLLLHKFVNRRRFPPALPFTAGKSLKERMESVGLSFMQYGSMGSIPENIRGSFSPMSFDEGKTGEPGCDQCHGKVMLCSMQHSALHPEKLGWFCSACGAGAVLPIAIKNRKTLGLPPVDSGDLFKILNVLERDAVKKGLLKPPSEVTEEEIPPVTFEATLDASTGYRDKPTRVRVDIAKQTVVPVDAIPNDGEGDEEAGAGEQPKPRMRVIDGGK